MKKPPYWEYRREWRAWWLVTEDGPNGRRGYGPFTFAEAKRAAPEHGVEPPKPEVAQKQQRESKDID